MKYLVRALVEIEVEVADNQLEGVSEEELQSSVSFFNKELLNELESGLYDISRGVFKVREVTVIKMKGEES